MHCLFIGGEIDGEYHEVDITSSTWQVDWAPPVPVHAKWDDPVIYAKQEVRRLTYKRIPWMADGRERFVYVMMHMTAIDALDKMINNYLPKAKRPR